MRRPARTVSNFPDAAQRRRVISDTGSVLSTCSNGIRLSSFSFLTCHLQQLADPTERGTGDGFAGLAPPVSYTHLRAHETGRNLVCRLLLEKKKSLQDPLKSIGTSPKKNTSRYQKGK